MQPFEKITEYSQAVCRQIRWKKARPAVAREITGHLLDQKAAYMREGAQEDAAAEKAIAQMGDPIEVGAQLDRIHRPRPQWGMLLLTLLLVAAGACLRFFLTEDGVRHISGRQFWALVLGLAALAATYLGDFTLIGKYPKATYYGVLTMVGLVLMLGWAHAHYSFPTGRLFWTLAPYISLLFPLAFAAMVYTQRGRGTIGVLLCGVSILPFLLVCLVIPNLIGFLMTAISGLVLLFAVIERGWFGPQKLRNHLLVALPTAAIVLAAALNLSAYHAQRLAALLHPETDPLGSGYITVTTRNLLAQAKLLGAGTLPQQYIGMERFPLPGTATDSFLTYLIFRLGWLPFAALMLVFGLFIAWGFVKCFRQKSELGFLVSVSVLLTFTYQVVNYVRFNLGIPLSAPLSLPLVSYGNTALVVNLGLIGLMLSVFRSGETAEDTQPRHHGVPRLSLPLIQWRDKKLIIDFGGR